VIYQHLGAMTWMKDHLNSIYYSAISFKLSCTRGYNWCNQTGLYI